MEEKLPKVLDLVRSCTLCPRECEVNRIENELGVCQIGFNPVYSSANLHLGEEPPISGYQGSGTIFLTGCNLNCMFCQNYPISQLRNGNIITVKILATLMLDLQDRGAHNINFVTPTHQNAAIYQALIIAYKKGLEIPLVYNSGGYESLKMLKLWDGIIDIYMPDSKYGNDESALKISNIKEYTKHNRLALKEMQRQVGVLDIDDRGVARRGLLIRHLVLPGDLAGSREVFRFIAEEISKETYISLMSQYFPAYKATGHKLLHRRVKRLEYDEAVEALEGYGLGNGWIQPI
ncbi:MAG: 4Fe-4S cluster-binding domain-containing protein [Candidatus Hatepunaea meridiana]|nr:4Fe-4S cluster-binding domain-containing protein [Candidatus Hatepunaea meridiana]